MNDDNKNFQVGLMVLLAAIIVSAFAVRNFGFTYSNRALTVGALVLFLFTLARVLQKLIAKVLKLAVAPIRLIGKISEKRKK